MKGKCLLVFLVAAALGLLACNSENPAGGLDDEGYLDWGGPTDSDSALPDGVFPDGEGVFPDGEGVFPDGEGVHPDGEGALPDGEGVHPDGEGVFPDGEGTYPDGSDVVTDGEDPDDDGGGGSDGENDGEPTDGNETPDGGDGVAPDADTANCECTTGACCDGCHYRSGTVCRAAVHPACDTAETCPGDSADCPVDITADPGDPCDDGLYCNGTDSCSGSGGCTTHSGDPCALSGDTCVEGTGCMTACQIAEDNESYVGCEYWGIFLQNLEEYTGGNYALVVANPNAETVSIKIFGSGNVKIGEGTVATKGIQSFVFTERKVTGPGISSNAYKLVSSKPVTVTQMNPFGNVNIYTNDATLLLPIGALGLEHYVMSWPTWSGYPGLISIAAVEPGTTSVKVRYAGASRAGTGGVAAQNAGDTVTYSLNQYQILTLNSADGGSYGPDLTGSFVKADKKIAVFGGHECTDVPADKPYCDHLEHQMFPLRSWGKDFVAVHAKPRGTEVDYWRILASQDGTNVSWTGGVSGSVTLNAGQFHQFSTTADFVVTADKAIMVGQILASRTAGAGGTGDPALMLIAPNEQFRKDYIFLVAPNYDYDRLTIVAQPDTNIVLDGSSMNSNSFAAIPGTSWYRQYIDTNDGARTLTSDKPVGLYVYGFSTDVSYAYTAGLDLVEIYSCWDLNDNGVCDVATEDLSGDGICNERDC